MKVEMNGKYRMNLLLHVGRDAEDINRAVSRDNESYIESTVRGNTILAAASSDDLMSIMRTADDFLSAVQLSFNILRKQSP